jgi:hypothetical protein
LPTFFNFFEETAMKTRVLWALAALNVFLLAGMFFPLKRTAAAPAAAARPGEYIIIPGEVTGGPSAVLYIIDETNRRLTARSYDENKKAFSDMTPLDLDRVFDVGGGRR